MMSKDLAGLPAIPDHTLRLQQLITFFETISPEKCKDLSTIYTEDAYFKDPFNELRDLPAITHVFQHMFEQVREPRFHVSSSVLQGESAFIVWDFLFKLNKPNAAELCIRGATHLRFAQDGRVHFHRDYWDAAEELYEKLPLLGSFMRFLKRQARR